MTVVRNRQCYCFCLVLETPPPYSLSRHHSYPEMLVTPSLGNYTVEESRGLSEHRFELLMSLFALIDDSGSDPTDPVYVLGGFAAPLEWWAELSVGWTKVLLSEPKLDYYKASEVWDWNKGAFKNFSKDQRLAKIEALVDVIGEYGLIPLTCRVRWSEFKHFNNSVDLPRECRNPYFFLFYGIISQMMVLMHETGGAMPTHFVFDEHRKIGKDVCRWYQHFHDIGNDEWQKLLGFEPQFMDEKMMPPLQCADMLSWYQRRFILGSLNEWDLGIWKRLTSRGKRSTEFFTDGLTVMARSLRLIR